MKNGMCKYVEVCYKSVGIAVPRKSLSYIAPRDFAEESEILYKLQLRP